MDISAALAADLTALTDALAEPGIDLEALLRALAADTRAAVPSYLGLTMRLIIDDHPLTLTTMDPSPVATSLLLPLSAVGDVEPGSVMVFYAATPGAFIDIAADVSFALGLDLGEIVLDQHLTPSSDPAGLSSQTGVQGLAEMSTLNQAIGILIEQGHAPEQAHAELERLAHHAQTTVAAAAQQLIHATIQQPGINLG